MEREARLCGLDLRPEVNLHAGPSIFVNTIPPWEREGVVEVLQPEEISAKGESTPE